MTIRAATDADWERIWPFWRATVEAGETYAYPEGLTSEQARDLWLERPPGTTVVLIEDGEVLGTAKMGPNRPGRGAHVGTASFMVAPRARGRGVGRRLAEHVVAWHRDHGFAAIQFNAVVETNTAAVALWRDLGFRIVGTVPRAFDSREHGLVGLHVMVLDLAGTGRRRVLAACPRVAAMTATPAIDGWFTTGPEPALIGSRCTTCSTVYFPPTSGFCRNPACAGDGFAAAELSRRGTVWSYTDARYQPPPPYIPAGDTHTPFALAAVELPEGLVVLGQVADGFGVEDIRVGAEVELVVETLYTDDQGERSIWRWKPVTDSSTTTEAHA